jgi:hypothetical protein
MTQTADSALPTDIWVVIPVLPGQAEAWRRFVQELQGPRRPEWESWCQRIGVSRLRVWLQANPKETTMLLRGRVKAEANGLLDEVQPFDRWLREQMLALHGVDIAQFGAGMKQELILEIETELSGGNYDHS